MIDDSSAKEFKRMLLEARKVPYNQQMLKEINRAGFVSVIVPDNSVLTHRVVGTVAMELINNLREISYHCPESTLDPSTGKNITDFTGDIRVRVMDAKSRGVEDNARWLNDGNIILSTCRFKSYMYRGENNTLYLDFIDAGTLRLTFNGLTCDLDMDAPYWNDYKWLDHTMDLF